MTAYEPSMDAEPVWTAEDDALDDAVREQHREADRMAAARERVGL